ncbi:MAG: NADH:flavin oxidoreductase [Synergistaceae bacterium]|jgi:2,4-dienoyl-CoA reductase-like NADH-dependent reductase (Old Yellow Enzyme family)|nr:NADH:flavin oxidoreductase [Synergistaceae bacterium]
MDVFDPIAIGGVTVKNRFARSATWEGMADTPELHGAATPELIRLMRDLAEGGTGLLLSSHAYVREDGQASLKQLGLYDDALLPGLRGMCEAAHGAGTGTLVFAQLAHGGVNANASLSGREPVAPTAMENARGERARAMTEEDIARLAESFADAAKRAKAAGFDGVQIHAAHAYCLGQFLSPHYNRRTDRYGGSAENRARAPIEVCRAVRGAVGKDYPVIAKINSEDFIDGGLTPSMMVETALMLESEGLDAIEMSGGGGPVARWLAYRDFDPRTPEEEVYYRDAARLYKSAVKKMPLLLVGNIRSLEVARGLLRDGWADMVSLSRPLIREPGLVNRWASGATRRAACVSCQGCAKLAAAGKGLRCVFTK